MFGINRYLYFNIKGDTRGSLVSLENFREVPFNTKRVYYIFGTKKGVARGYHAHKNLQQVLICVSGSCIVKIDDGDMVKEYKLDRPDVGLFVGEMIWREMNNFSDDCVLLVLASDYYDEQDYIREYDLFIEEKFSIKFVPYDKTFLELSKKWLNDPELKTLTMTPDFDDESQLKWYNSLKNRKDYYINGILYKDQPIGAMGIKNINSSCGEYWGYIAEKQLWGKKLGKYLINHAVKQAKLLKLDYLYLKVDLNNHRAIKLYEKCGFKLQFKDENIMYMIKYIHT